MTIKRLKDRINHGVIAKCSPGNYIWRNIKMRQTTMTKPSEVVRQWYIVDATNCTLGRLATEVATVLRGKHKPTYTPNVDCGDFVIVVNADKIKITGDQDAKKF